MNIFKKFFGKKKQVAALPDLNEDIRRKARKYNYICDCTINFDGQPVRRVKFNIPAYTRRHAEQQIRENMKIQVVKSYKQK